MSPTPRAVFWFCLSTSVLFACKTKSPESSPPPAAKSIDAAPVAKAVAIDAAPVAKAIDAAPPGKPDDFVDITTLDKTVALDIRYAGKNNFAKRVVYPVARCLLRRAVAEKLVEASRELAKSNLRFKIWDCYRPFRVQEDFWKLVPDGRYVAKPVRKDGVPFKGSKHNRGAAVDITLVDADGNELDMPTDYDDFSKRAHRDAKTWSAEQRKNVKALTDALTGVGFETIATEWWHFDGPQWRDYPLADEPLADNRN